MPDTKIRQADTEDLKYEVASYVQARWGAEAVCVLIVAPKDDPSATTMAATGNQALLVRAMRRAAEQIEAGLAKGGP